MVAGEPHSADRARPHRFGNLRRRAGLEAADERATLSRMDAVSTSVEARHRALVEALPDLLLRVSPLGAGTLVRAELPD